MAAAQLDVRPQPRVRMPASQIALPSNRWLLGILVGCASGFLLLWLLGMAWTVDVRGPLLLDGRHQMWIAPHPVLEIGRWVVLPAIALAATSFWVVQRATSAARVVPYASRLGAIAGAVCGGILGGAVLYFSTSVVRASPEPDFLRFAVEDISAPSLVLGHSLWMLGPRASAVLGPIVDGALLGTALGLVLDLARARFGARSA
jgi:hypothetical protein